MGQYVPYDPSEIPGGFLNNFFLRFLIGDKPYPRDPEIHEGNFRQYARRLGDRTFGSNVRSAIYGGKLSSQTGLGFIDDVDCAIAESGLTVEEVGRVINTYLHDRSGADTETYQRLSRLLNTFLLPIYIALRNKGYDAHDLWG